MTASSLAEGVWNKKRDELEEEKSELVRTERSEGIMDVVVTGESPPLSGEYVESRRRSNDWACLQPWREIFLLSRGQADR